MKHIAPKHVRFLKWNLRCLLKAINIFIIAFCIFSLVLHTLRCVQQYLANETRAVLNVQPTAKFTYLAFTICPSFEDAYKEDMLSKLSSAKDQIRAGDFNLHDMDWVKDRAFEKITHEYDEIIEKLKIVTEVEAQSSIVLKTKESYYNKVNVTPLFHLKLGRCYSLELLPTLTILGIVRLIFTGKIDFYVYFHHPNQFLDKDSKTKIYANTGRMGFLDVGFAINENTLAQESIIPCDPDDRYRFDDCTYKAIKEKLLKKFGCLVPSLPPEEYGTSQVCINKTSSEAEALMDYYSHLVTTRNCMISCKTMEVYLGVLQTSDGTNGSSYVKLNMKSTVKYRKKILDYTWMNMWAEIGGYEGLLLGMAIVSVTSWIKKLSERLN